MHVMRQFDLSFYDNYSDVIYTYSYYGLDNNNLWPGKQHSRWSVVAVIKYIAVALCISTSNECRIVPNNLSVVTGFTNSAFS